MVKWSISLVLALLLAGSAIAGVPLHFGEKKCPMMGTDDCCEKAESKSATPQAAAARLCCSLNCSQPGTTGPTGTTVKGPSNTHAPYSALNTPAAYPLPLRELQAFSVPERNQHAPPIYLQHLALLI
jgi:hypothetical protein